MDYCVDLREKTTGNTFVTIFKTDSHDKAWDVANNYNRIHGITEEEQELLENGAHINRSNTPYWATVYNDYEEVIEPKMKEEKEMTYQEKIKDLLQWMYETVCDFAGSATYDIPYEWVKDGYQLDLTKKDVQDDIKEMWGSEYLDLFQAMDFDDLHQKVYVMTWTSNRKKKYTLKEWEAFCKEALIMPPFEDDNQIEEWFKTHKIHITTNNCDMELEYDADAVNEIEFSLREIYNAIHGDGTATTGNTIGSEYRDATWKDIVRLNIMRRVYDGKSMKEAIHFTIYNFDVTSYTKCMNEINNQTSYNDEFKVNFFKISSDGMEELFEASSRRMAIKEMLGKEIQLSEMIDMNGAHDDKTVITDYSIHPAGHLVGWHYGVDWDINSSVNQQYINDYIKEMIGND